MRRSEGPYNKMRTGWGLRPVRVDSRAVHCSLFTQNLMEIILTTVQSVVKLSGQVQPAVFNCNCSICIMAPTITGNNLNPLTKEPRNVPIIFKHRG